MLLQSRHRAWLRSTGAGTWQQEVEAQGIQEENSNSLRLTNPCCIEFRLRWTPSSLSALESKFQRALQLRPETPLQSGSSVDRG